MDPTFIGIDSWRIIIGYLGTKDVLELSCTCRAFRKLALISDWLLTGGCAVFSPTRPLTKSFFTRYGSVTRSLLLRNARIEDLQRLPPLPTLDKFGLLDYDESTDISAIARFQNLSHLDLHMCDSVTAASLVSLVSLSLLSSLRLDFCHNINDLGPLAACPALQTLVFKSCGAIKDLNPLSSCTLLHKLEMGNCRNLNNIQALSSCVALHTLKLEYCRNLSDIQSLAYCTALVSLTISHTKVRDISILVCCPLLRKLALTGCYQLESIQPLAQCPALRLLDLSSNEFEDLSVLASCPELQNLILNNAQFLDYSSLRSLRKLQIVQLVSHSTSTDISLLLASTELKELEWGGRMDITRVPSLASFPQIEILDLSLLMNRRHLMDITAIASLVNLRNLKLSGCGPWTDITPLGACKALEILHLSNCKGITSLSSLRGCAKLLDLSIDRCENFEDLSALETCCDLHNLSIHFCQKLTSIEPLRFYGSLAVVTLRNTQITDLLPLQYCKSLARVRIRNNYEKLQGDKLLRDKGISVFHNVVGS